MATYKTDFSEYTVGSHPSDWTDIWVTTNDTWTIASVADATDGQTLRHTATADARRLITWNTVGSVTGDFDVLLKWKTTDSLSGNIPTRIFAYASGSATQTTQQGFQLDALFPATLRIGRTVNGSYSTLASNTAMPIAFQPNTWYWFRFRRVGSSLMGRAWKDGDAEQATWDVSTSSTSLTSGSIGIGSYDYEGTRDYDYFSVGTNGDSAPSSVEAPPPDTTAPAEITNLTETHTDIVIEFNWTKPTDSDFYGVNVYKNGTKIAGDLGSTFTDTNVSPNTTYLYRFTTVDTIGNESNGTEISVTTDPQKQYRHLKPIEIVSINNFTPNDVTYIQDDPMNEDANVLTTIDNLSNPSIRLKFETPDSPISGLQTMRWVVDDPYYVGSRITIYDSGVQVYQSGMKYPQGGTQPIVETFNADVLTDTTMQNVEVVLEATVYQGDTIANLGAIEWTFPVDETMVPIDGSIIGTSSASASLSKSYNVSGSLSVASIIEGSVFTDRGLNGQADSHSSINNPVLGLSFNVTGSVALVSDSSSVLDTDRGIEGAIISQSNVMGEIGILRAMNTDVSLFTDLTGDIGVNRGLDAITSAFSDVRGEMNIFRSMDGNVNAVSSVSDVQFLLYRELDANVIEAKSTINPISLLKVIPIDGYIEADSINSGMIEKEMTLQGDIFGDSSVTGAINRSILIDGMMTSVSNVEVENLFIYREVSGTVSGISSLTASFFVRGEVTLTGKIINQSIISSSLTALKPLEGDVTADSVTYMEQIQLFRSINGGITGNSSVESSLNKLMGMEGMIDEFSSLDGMVSRFIPMDSSIDISSTMNSMLQKELLLSSSIEVNSNMESLLNKLVRLDSSVQAYSSLQDADLWLWRELNASVFGQSSLDAVMNRLRDMNGGIDVHSILSAEFSVEGEIGLNGSIFTLSGMVGLTNVDRSITGMIESDSEIYPAFLNRGISIDGDILSQSDVSVFLSRLYGIEGSTGAISELDGLINKRRSMSGRISSRNSIEASMWMLWGMAGQVEGNTDLEAESMVFYDLGGGLVAQSSLNGQTIILVDLTTETIAAVSTLLTEGLVNVSPPKIDVIRLNGQMMVRIQLKAEQDIVSRLKAEHETVVRLDGDLSG